MRPLLALRLLLPGVHAALHGLRRSPWRSLLLLQGVVWATVLGVLPPAILRGSKEGAIERANELGTNRVVCYETSTERRFAWSLRTPLSGRLPSSVTSLDAFRRAGDAILVDSPTALSCDRRVVSGRWFSATELAEPERAGVCLVSAARAEMLGGLRAALERTVEVSGLGANGSSTALRVIGVFEIGLRPTAALDEFGYEKDHVLHGVVREFLEHMGVAGRDFEWLWDESLVVAPSALRPSVPPDLLVARASPRDLAAVSRVLQRELVRLGAQPIVVVNPVAQILFSGPMETVDKLHVAVFVVCLLVGTIIVTNTMLLAVLARRRELAVRRVEGATTAAIVAQILTESLVLCLAGGALGVPLALGLAWLRSAADPSGTLLCMVPWREIAQTILAVSVFGLLGGLAPAWRAARLQPARVLSGE